MIEPAQGSKVGMIALAIDRFNRTGSAGAGRRFGNTSRYRIERFVQSGAQILTLGKLVNPHERLDMLLVLSWEFGADGQLQGVDVCESAPDPMSAPEAKGAASGAAANV